MLSFSGQSGVFEVVYIILLPIVVDVDVEIDSIETIHEHLAAQQVTAPFPQPGFPFAEPLAKSFSYSSSNRFEDTDEGTPS